ncbi:hypothetical protein E2C01_069387 [Portunus trituberculatus]|uniref:Uncharacterized protein n=1 Tax=Portunus trituberculatus TaxID=210409 RepID=A0A5B7I2N0_PORTR|nr:hypothetical protein [Portunus trituberculatus]
MCVGQLTGDHCNDDVVLERPRRQSDKITVNKSFARDRPRPQAPRGAGGAGKQQTPQLWCSKSGCVTPTYREHNKPTDNSSLINYRSITFQ